MGTKTNDAGDVEVKQYLTTKGIPPSSIAVSKRFDNQRIIGVLMTLTDYSDRSQSEKTKMLRMVSNEFFLDTIDKKLDLADGCKGNYIRVRSISKLLQKNIILSYSKGEQTSPNSTVLCVKPSEAEVNLFVSTLEAKN